MYDVVIIGAGVNGSAIARELSKYQLKTAVLERCTDICEGTSKANSGIAHAGYDAKSGTLKAKLNVAGSRMIRQLSKELDFAYEQNGSLVLCFDEKDRNKLEELLHRGEQNGRKIGAAKAGAGDRRSGSGCSLCAYRGNCLSVRTYDCTCRKCSSERRGILSWNGSNRN